MALFTVQQHVCECVYVRLPGASECQPKQHDELQTVGTAVCVCLFVSCFPCFPAPIRAWLEAALCNLKRQNKPCETSDTENLQITIIHLSLHLHLFRNAPQLHIIFHLFYAPTPRSLSSFISAVLPQFLSVSLSTSMLMSNF